MRGACEYSLYCSIFLLIGYAVYKLALAGVKMPGWNRLVLLAIYIVSMTAFFWIPSFEGESQPVLSVYEGPEVSVNGQAVSVSAPWANVILWVWMAGCFMVAVRMIMGFVGLGLLIKRSRIVDRVDGYAVMVTPRGKVSPFSWGRCIVISERDYSSDDYELILLHELTHLKVFHSADIILAQIARIVCWYNPAAWLLTREIQRIHEYEVDERVLASGVDAHRYQMSLVRMLAGGSCNGLIHNFNSNNFKKRISMMYKSNPGLLGKLRYLALAIVPVAAVAVVNIPAVASTLDSVSSASFPAVGDRAGVKSENTEIVMNYCEQGENISSPAHFPGGDAEMMKFMMKNLRYPADAQEANVKGRVVVAFTINVDGSLSNIRCTKSVYPSLDEEAVRMVKSMPAWVPAVNADGKKVATTYSLPISFRM